MAWKYDQSSGELTYNGGHVATGYSGRDWGKNNPSAQAAPGIGPIPAGEWRIAGKRKDFKTGEAILDLFFLTGTNVPGRTPGEFFTMHSDTSPVAGESGIAMPANVRDMIEVGPLTKLRVVQ